MFEIVVVADENDADYLTKISTIDLETLKKLMPILQVIKNNDNVWEDGERGSPYSTYGHGDDIADDDPDYYGPVLLTKDQIKLMEKYMPYSEYGLHTLISVEYYPLPEKVKLYDHRAKIVFWLQEI